MPPLIAAALVVLCEAMCFTTALPVISYFTQALGGDGRWVGAMLALMTVPKIVSGPLWGTLSDRMGRRPILILNTLGTMGGSVLWALSGNLWMLAASRLMIGLFGGQAGLTQAIAADVSRPEKRAAAMGVLGAAFAVAFAVGPLLGGWLGRHYGYASVGWLCAGLQVCSMTVILLALRETRPSVTDGASPDAAKPSAIDGAAGEPGVAQRVAGPAIVLLLMTVGLSEINSTLGLHAERNYGMKVDDAGWLFAFLGFVSALVAGGGIRQLVKRTGERSLVLAGLILLIWGLQMLSGTPPGIYLWVATALIAIGSALSSTCLSALISRMVDAGQQGRLMGFQQMVLSIGRGGGALLGGAVFQRHGPLPTYGLAAAIVFLSLLALLFVRTPGLSKAGAPAAR